MFSVYGTNAPAYGMRSNESAQTTSNANDVLGKDDFLKLFTAQMTNQDPMSPTDNNDMLAQLAQFSLVEQIINMSESLTDLKGIMTGLYYQSLLTQGASLIGKEVMARDEEGNMLSGEVLSVKWNGTDLLLRVGEDWVNIVQVSEIKETNK